MTTTAKRTSPNPANGLHDARGKFAKGNPGGPGNPHAARVAKLRAALLDAITPEAITAVVKALVSEAKAGNVAAAKELLDRAVGKVADPAPAPAGDDDAPTGVVIRFPVGGPADAVAARFTPTPIKGN